MRVIVLLLMLAPFFTAQAADAPSAPLQWKALHYRLSLLFVSAEADVYWRQLSVDELKHDLVKPDDLTPIANGNEAYEISIRTDNLGRRSDTKLWYRPDLQVLQMTRHDSGKQHRQKVYRYLPDGFWSFQRSPKDDAEIADESRWSEQSTKVVHKPAALKQVPVIEDSMLFQMVSVLPLRKKGDSYEYYSYINDAVFRNRLEVVGLRDVEVDYVEKFPDHDKWREGERELLLIRVTSTAMDAKNQDDFEIMGLKGNLSLYIDPKTGVLVQLSGHVDYLGRVNITLYKVEF